MYLKHLNLQTFRSFTKKDFSFSQKLNLITGVNTAGKTNILEAIYLLATGKSFRAEMEKEMISYGEEMARVKGVVNNGESIILEIILTTGQISGQPAPTKKYLLNDVSKRMIDFLGNLRAVLFWPQDMELVIGSPSIRRRYLDMVLTQVDREYRRSLSIYEKAVRQRNRLLERIRDEGISRAQLTYWDELLIKHGGLLTDKRQEFVEFVDGFHSNPNFEFSIDYDKSVISENRLDQYKNEEVAAATTLVGPHRDDIKFFIGNKRDLSIYGSRGEQRLGILWLKLAELEYISQKNGERPILLLDDIFSELDHEHRDYVLNVIPNQQTIMTTTDLHLIEKNHLKDLNMIEL